MLLENLSRVGDGSTVGLGDKGGTFLARRKGEYLQLSRMERVTQFDDGVVRLGLQEVRERKGWSAVVGRMPSLVEVSA